MFKVIIHTAGEQTGFTHNTIEDAATFIGKYLNLCAKLGQVQGQDYDIELQEV